MSNASLPWTDRVRAVNTAAVRGPSDGTGARFVLYWMTAARRPSWNFALDRALAWARELGLPLVVLEALRLDYPRASDRLHRFVLQGMADQRRAFAKAGLTYHAYVEPARNAGRGLVAALGKEAAVVVTDDFPCFFLPRAVRAAGAQLDVRLEAIDGNGLLPLSRSERAFTTAYSFRRFLQKHLPDHLEDFPQANPLRGLDLPRLARPPQALQRWPAATDRLLEATPAALARLEIDHRVGAGSLAGGAAEAERRVQTFVRTKLDAYDESRNHPDRDATSGLSAYLHFGHVSPHRIFAELARREDWSPTELSSETAGKRSGWWNMSTSAEAFLDQLVTWRELGYVFCHHRADYDDYASLPAWARTTLAEHENDPREHVYEPADFEAARTHDELWNAAQRQLLRDGVLHNYLRMVWGKKILEWTPSPRAALDVLITLNDTYALDGRDPNSYSGIFWTLGRFDRAWGPQRRVFGKVRYMTTANTRRKVRVKDYLETFGAS